MFLLFSIDLFTYLINWFPDWQSVNIRWDNWVSEFVQLQVQVSSYSNLRSFTGTNWKICFRSCGWLQDGVNDVSWRSSIYATNGSRHKFRLHCIPETQGLSQLPRIPYMNHPLPNPIPSNSSPVMNPTNTLNIVNQMQNVHLILMIFWWSITVESSMDIRQFEKEQTE